MLSFKKLTIDDIDIIKPYFIYSRSNKCDATIGGTIMWTDFLKYSYAVIEKTLIIKSNFNDNFETFFVPIGEAENHCIELLYEYSNANKQQLHFSTVTDRELAVIEKKFIVEKELCPQFADYIYEASDLINLPGRKYHGQKNHINYFLKTYTNFSFEEYSKNNSKEIEDFLTKYDSVVSKESPIYKAEIKANFDVIDKNDRYGFNGLVLRVDGNICAFSMGEKLKNTLHVHIEKADKNIRGSYPMIMNEFAKRYASDMKYINREDSAGDPGLESSKLQYHPTTILNKYFVKVISRR